YIQNVIDLAKLKFVFASRRRHTRSTRDWSSDVCSSDLDIQSAAKQRVVDQELLVAIPTGRTPQVAAFLIPGVSLSNVDVGGTNKIGRASCRERWRCTVGVGCVDVACRAEGRAREGFDTE